MRFVPVKSADSQARAMLFRTRQMLVGQRTQLINALRGHMAEYGFVTPKGRVHLKPLIEAITDGHDDLPLMARELGQLYLEQIEVLDARIAKLDEKIKATSKEPGVARRLQTMPGVGPLTALAIEAFAPDMTDFKRGRDFAA